MPIQLGGLQDPFTPREQRLGVTLELLKVLRDEQYPTIISTKGSLFLGGDYLNVLSEMNLVFRLSAAGVKEALRPVIDRNCDPFDATLRKIDSLTQKNVPVALRIQPVFPGHEADALEMATKAATAGAIQITFEYLKLPSEIMRKELAILTAHIGYDVVASMEKMGLNKVGPDWTLKPETKRPFVRSALAHCRKLGIRFGAGDTEFIPWSDGNGCCGSSDLFLVNCNQFTTNFVGAIKHALSTPTKKVNFEYFHHRWSPALSVGNYFEFACADSGPPPH